MINGGRMRRWVRAIVIVLALIPLVARGTRAAPGPDLDGAWQGSIVAGPATGAAVSTLTQHGARIGGTMTVDAGDVHGTFALAGRARGVAVRVRGRLGRARLAWRGTATPDASAWSGPLRVRGGGHRMRGMLSLSRDAAGGAHCGDAYFASDVMPRVLQPICAQCHVQGGMATGAPFRVTVGDAAATGLSARREVDATDPSQSRILLKPRGELAHGGGQRVLPGSPEDQVLVQWVSLLTAAGCGDPGGGGGPTTGAGLYAESCATCHGSDAGGTAGKPAIRCAVRVSDAVRNGRGTAMPSFPLADAEIALVAAFLDGLCTANGRTGSDLYAGNCSTCHGPTARGARNALGIAGPDIACAGSGDFQEKVHDGDGRMPAFPELTTRDIGAMFTYVRAQLCPGG
jgi:mono/diheme cytochrome c family protein